MLIKRNLSVIRVLVKRFLDFFMRIFVFIGVVINMFRMRLRLLSNRNAILTSAIEFFTWDAKPLALMGYMQCRALWTRVPTLRWIAGVV